MLHNFYSGFYTYKHLYKKRDGHVHIVGSVVLVAIITMVYIMYMLIKTHSSNSSIHR